MKPYFGVHNHTAVGSNIRLIDSINKPEDLIDKAIELGLSGIAITDHECLSAHVEAEKHMKKIKEQHPDFKLALGNEIYLVDERKPGQKYYHFILIAKDAVGHRALRELSSRAWMNSYVDRRLERVPTTKEELAEVVQKYKGHLIATTACFIKGTQVLTESGLKPIEKISNQDFVLNMNGEWEQVIEPTARFYQGQGKKITFLENPVPTICTENHKFLATTNNKLMNYKRRGTDPRVWVEAKDLITTRGGTKHICLFPMRPIEYTNNQIINKAEWQYQLRKNYNSKIHINPKINITPEVMRLFGLWLGDGSISINPETNYYNINLTFSSDEFENYWEDFVQSASVEIGIEWSINKREENHRIDLTSHSVELVELFFYLFGNSKADSKYIPQRLLHISKELDFNLIFGFLLADGYFRTRSKDGYIYGESIATSISFNLINDIQNLFKDYGIRASITTKESYISQNINHKKSYYLSSSNNAWINIDKKNHILNSDILRIFEAAIKNDEKKTVVINNIKYKKVYIKQIEDIYLKEQVYCLNNTTHSFVCNGALVHNCIGGELPSLALTYTKARMVNDNNNAMLYYKQIDEFIKYCLNLFGEDFYIECAPGTSAEQIAANQACRKISNLYGIKMVVGTDAHYLDKSRRSVHKAYLNSKEGDREVDSFYEFTYLMDYDEVTTLLAHTFDGDINFACEVVDNTLDIQNKIESYSLFHKQDIPSVEVKDYPKAAWWGVNNDYADEMKHRFPTICELFVSDDIQNRYWINQCWDKLDELDKGWVHYCETGDDRYIVELEEEARVKKVISEKLETNMFRYPNTLQHYIDLIWDCGSMVGAGRGSSCAALNHYLMGITQLDPIEWELPFFRYLNEERIELPDIDIDLCPSKVGLILSKIAAERSQMFNDEVPEWAKKLFGCTRIATFGTEGTKSAILTACRGYRSEDYPDGIDVDQAQYMASLIPQERGYLWSIKDVIYGNEEKNRKPVKSFIREINNYPGLLDIITGIENLVNKRSSHASGVLFFDSDPFAHCAFMKTPKGEIITQWDLHDIEYMGQ